MEQRDYGDETPEPSGYTINDCTCGVNDQQAGEHHSPLCAGYTGSNINLEAGHFHPDEFMNEFQDALNNAGAKGETIIDQITNFFGIASGGNDASDQKSQ